MRSKTSFSGGYSHWTLTGLAVLVCLVTPAHAQDSSPACKLLQVVEIESALGGKSSTKPSGSSQNVPGLGFLGLCSVEISRPSQGEIRQVSISVVKNLPMDMDGSEAIRVRNAGTASQPQ